MLAPPPRPPLFPYTTLFRSDAGPAAHHDVRVDAEHLVAKRLLEPGRDAEHDGQHGDAERDAEHRDRKSTRLNSSHVEISYAVFCLKKKKKKKKTEYKYTNKN